MIQPLSVSIPVSFASDVGSLRPPQPAQAFRPDRAQGQQSQHPKLRPRSKKSIARPSDRWQARKNPLETPGVPISTRRILAHAPQRGSLILLTPLRLSQAAGEGDPRITELNADIRSQDGLIPAPLLGKASIVDHAMAVVGYGDAQALAAKRYERSERMPNPEERRAQLWLGQLLNEPGMMEALKGYVLRRHPRASVGEKFKDIRQMALLDAWRRIARAIAPGGEGQRGNEEDPDNLDTEGARYVDRVLCKAIRDRDRDAFQRMARTLIFNQINYKAAELRRKETQETIQTVPLDPATVDTTGPRRKENLAPNDYSEPNDNSLIDPDLYYPNTPEEAEELEKNQSEGQRLKESWLNWLKGIHDSTANVNHKRRLKACIDFEHLAFVDDGEVSINKKIRNPEDDDPYLYHAFLGRTHGARQELAEKHGVSLRYFEQELHRMRKEYWPAWVASVIEEMK